MLAGLTLHLDMNSVDDLKKVLNARDLFVQKRMAFGSLIGCAGAVCLTRIKREREESG